MGKRIHVYEFMQRLTSMLEGLVYMVGDLDHGDPEANRTPISGLRGRSPSPFRRRGHIHGSHLRENPIAALTDNLHGFPL